MKIFNTFMQKTLFVVAASLVLALPIAGIVRAQGVLDDCPVPDAVLCEDAANSQTPKSNAIYGKDGIMTKVIRLLSFVIGFAAVIMIIIGGFKYVVSAGEPASVNSAKNTILYAVIGLVIAGSAQAIIIFVLNKL